MFGYLPVYFGPVSRLPTQRNKKCTCQADRGIKFLLHMLCCAPRSPYEFRVRRGEFKTSNSSDKERICQALGFIESIVKTPKRCFSIGSFRSLEESPMAFLKPLQRELVMVEGFSGERIQSYEHKDEHKDHLFRVRLCV